MLHKRRKRLDAAQEGKVIRDSTRGQEDKLGRGSTNGKDGWKLH
jgi:hypothetical protein